jgi:hypothetical protein
VKISTWLSENPSQASLQMLSDVSESTPPASGAGGEQANPTKEGEAEVATEPTTGGRKDKGRKKNRPEALDTTQEEASDIKPPKRQKREKKDPPSQPLVKAKRNPARPHRRLAFDVITTRLEKLQRRIGRAKMQLEDAQRHADGYEKEIEYRNTHPEANENAAPAKAATQGSESSDPTAA